MTRNRLLIIASILTVALAATAWVSLPTWAARRFHHHMATENMPAANSMLIDGKVEAHTGFNGRMMIYVTGPLRKKLPNQGSETSCSCHTFADSKVVFTPRSLEDLVLGRVEFKIKDESKNLQVPMSARGWKVRTEWSHL